MARKRRRFKKKKKKKSKLKGYSYFSNTRYNTYNYRKKKQRGSFLNRYDFAYAGRDTVSQAGKELERIGPGLIKKAVEELYQTPFRLLETIGKKKYNLIKKNVSNELKKLKLT